ncbi:hypothetical protein PAL_GLEAN10000841 [Pteropus alecto]|uniref:Uncharacterized protein n=1 Tax=Pteropus alecto TaxID=9402 RepID=L5KCA4_PTEAL|nr:hypothetical protein PAL_GLEAN10000841 [Pteropus alecto]
MPFMAQLGATVSSHDTQELKRLLQLTAHPVLAFWSPRPQMNTAVLKCHSLPSDLRENLTPPCGRCLFGKLLV